MRVPTWLHEALAFVSNLRGWLRAQPVPIASARTRRQGDGFFLTGPDLINRLVRSIELDQSVILSGPRGCGKSYCIGEAIREAQKRGLLLKHTDVFLQGNRETPRDYLIEDEIGFKTRVEKGKRVVEPARKYAPLFRHAVRDSTTDAPPEPSGDDPWVPFAYQPPADESGERPEIISFSRFVLFLDEINRFSDGVLDSLLSVLEEKKAVMGGVAYRVPVTVLMTMNPPGYDSSARKLSPPLAARINRGFRLSSPDLDTMSDLIIASRWKSAEKQWRAGQSNPKFSFPNFAPKLVRLAGLVTLCLWGDERRELDASLPDGSKDLKSGHEYLTADSRALLRMVQRNKSVHEAMQSLHGLSRFGPDGRAGADWVVSALGRCVDEAESLGLKAAKLQFEHFRATAVESLSHKIYDSFNPATEPEKVAQKEEAVRVIVREVFRDTTIHRFEGVLRRMDDEEWLDQEFGAIERSGPQIRQDLLSCGLRSDAEVERIASALRVMATDEQFEAALCSSGVVVRRAELHEDGLVAHDEGDPRVILAFRRFAEFCLLDLWSPYVRKEASRRVLLKFLARICDVDAERRSPEAGAEYVADDFSVVGLLSGGPWRNGPERTVRAVAEILGCDHEPEQGNGDERRQLSKKDAVHVRRALGLAQRVVEAQANDLPVVFDKRGNNLKPSELLAAIAGDEARGLGDDVAYAVARALRDAGCAIAYSHAERLEQARGILSFVRRLQGAGEENRVPVLRGLHEWLQDYPLMELLSNDPGIGSLDGATVHFVARVMGDEGDGNIESQRLNAAKYEPRVRDVLTYVQQVVNSRVVDLPKVFEAETSPLMADEFLTRIEGDRTVEARNRGEAEERGRREDVARGVARVLQSVGSAVAISDPDEFEHALGLLRYAKRHQPDGQLDRSIGANPSRSDTDSDHLI